MRSISIKAVMALLFWVTSSAASAIPIQWTIDNFIFDDGGAAQGSFVFEADTGTYSDIMIFTTAGTARAGASYGTIWSFAPNSPTNTVLTTLSGDLSGGSYVRLDWASALTNAGGTVFADSSFSEADEGTCVSAGCNNAQSPFRNFLSGGQATGVRVAVPEPSAIALLGLGLFALLGYRRRLTS